MSFHLPASEAEALSFYERSWRDGGSVPTIRDVMRALDLSCPRSAELVLQRLMRKGYLRHTPKIARAYRLPYSPDTAIQQGRHTASATAPMHQTGSRVPIVGRVPGGPPSTQERENLGELHLPMRVSPGSYAVRVEGDSMKDAHILDGDVVVADPSVTPTDGSVVIAVVGEEYTIKTLRHPSGKEWWLDAANDDFKSIHPQLETDRVEASIVALFRGRIGKRPPSRSW